MEGGLTKKDAESKCNEYKTLVAMVQPRRRRTTNAKKTLTYDDPKKPANKKKKITTGDEPDKTSTPISSQTKTPQDQTNNAPTTSQELTPLKSKPNKTNTKNNDKKKRKTITSKGKENVSTVHIQHRKSHDSIMEDAQIMMKDSPNRPNPFQGEPAFLTWNKNTVLLK